MTRSARVLASVVFCVMVVVSITAALTSSSSGRPPAGEWCLKHPKNPHCTSPTPTRSTTVPTTKPTTAPTTVPTSVPTTKPTTAPTTVPTTAPTGQTCTVPPGVLIPEGSGRTFGQYFVHNNNWNDNYGGTHVITACNYNNWFVVADVPNHGDNAVEAYPNVHKDYDDAPVSGITSADFAGVGPRCTGCIYNTAFDIWIGSGFSHELMIWTENFGQRPAGNQVGTVTIGGHSYQVWRSGTGDGGILTYVASPIQLSGNMPLSAFFADARSRGWTVSTTWQVDFGVEIVDTNGTPQTFRFTGFEIH